MSHTRDRSAHLAVIFSCLGHAYMRLFAVYFFLIALPLERDWKMSYPTLIELWTVGSFLVGAMAMPAGWLADRWSPSAMMDDLLRRPGRFVHPVRRGALPDGPLDRSMSAGSICRDLPSGRDRLARVKCQGVLPS